MLILNICDVMLDFIFGNINEYTVNPITVGCCINEGILVGCSRWRIPLVLDFIVCRLFLNLRREMVAVMVQECLVSIFLLAFSSGLAVFLNSIHCPLC